MLEILELKEMLEKAKIPFTFNDDFFQYKKDNERWEYRKKYFKEVYNMSDEECEKRKDSYQIIVYDNNHNRICDAIFHWNSSSFEEGLLELLIETSFEMAINGFGELEEELTAKEAFTKMKECYDRANYENKKE